MRDDEFKANQRRHLPPQRPAPLDLQTAATLIRSLERDLASVPGLTQAVAALGAAAADLEQMHRPLPLIASILRNRQRTRGLRH